MKHYSDHRRGLQGKGGRQRHPAQLLPVLRRGFAPIPQRLCKGRTMIDIPIGKALVPVENENGCVGCFLEGVDIDCARHRLECQRNLRKDGKNVIFKIVDFLGKPQKYVDNKQEPTLWEKLDEYNKSPEGRAGLEELKEMFERQHGTKQESAESLGGNRQAATIIGGSNEKRK